METAELITRHFKPALSANDADYILSTDEILDILESATGTPPNKCTLFDSLSKEGFVNLPLDKVTHFEFKWLLKKI